MKDLLLQEKYRPKTLDEIILLPRIRAIFENGVVNQNYIFKGHFGTGKTSLARILIGRYSKDKPNIELNSSFYTSIDTLRTEVDEFCSNVYMGFDLERLEQSQSDYKYVFLDEYEKTSPAAQDAFKAYIEKYYDRVRFILNTNHVNKINEGIRSRMIEVDFNCKNRDEEKYLKKEIYNRIMNVIVPNEGLDLTPEQAVTLVNKNFPDFRSMLVQLEDYKITGQLQLGVSIDLKLRDELYSQVFDHTKSYDDIYHFLMDNFGADNIHQVIKLFGSEFVNYILSEKKNVDLLFPSNYVIADYSKVLESSTDPIILGMTIIGKLRGIWQK